MPYTIHHHHDDGLEPYKLYIGWQNSNYPRSMQLWGTKIDNNESELTLLTPKMDSDVTSWGKLTYSKLYSGSASDLTDVSPSSSIYIQQNPDDAEDLSYWIKYEFTEPQIANFLDVAGTYDYLDRTMRWYKLEGSNDDENWNLLLERQYQRDFYRYETRWHEFENNTAYKFYKLTCISNSRADGYWRISRFRLFYRDHNGKWNFYSSIPKLSSATQDGYEISASSQYNSGHAPFYAFDGDSSTKWASSGTGTQWLQIKFPTATVCNIAKITSRSDGYLNQTPTEFEIKGSNDAETWDSLLFQTGVTWSSSGETQTFAFKNNESAYLYYRLVITADGGGSDYSLGEFSLGMIKYEHKRQLHKYKYLVPQLTSNTSASGYVASASSEYSNDEGAWRAFDRQSNQWTTKNGTNKNVTLKIQLPQAMKCDLIMLGISNANSRIPQTFRIEASNDNSNWTVLYQDLEGANLSVNTNYLFENPYKNTAFKYYRLYVLTNKGDGFISLREFQLIQESRIQEY